MKKMIKGKYPLADTFNIVLGKLSVLKSISEPVTFCKKELRFSELYYDIILYERYIRETMLKLTNWIEDIEIYKSVGYDHSEFIAIKEKQYIDSSIIDSEDNIPIFSFKSCFVCEDYRDIVLDCSDRDIISMINTISAMSRFDICSFFKIPSYKIDENGNMVERTFADREMDKASDSVMFDYVCSTMLDVNREIHSLVDYVKGIDDNGFTESVVQKMENSVTRVLNLKIV